MSDTSQGEGWWQASDLKWYPPETHPSYRPALPPRPEPPVSESPPAAPAPRVGAQYPPLPVDDVSKRRQFAAYAVAAGAAMLVVGSFLPWAKVTATFLGAYSSTISGVDNGRHGWISVGLGLAMGVVAWQFLAAAKAGTRAPIVLALLVSLAAIGLTVYEWIDISNALDEVKSLIPAQAELPDDFGIDFKNLFEVEQAVGLYVIGLAGLVGAGGALAYKQPATA